MSDVVNHPKHYKSHPSGIECKDIASYFPSPLANAIKYIWRYEAKENPIQDLEKCLWYCKHALFNFPNGMIEEQLAITEKYLNAQIIHKYTDVESNIFRKEFMYKIQELLFTKKIRHIYGLCSIVEQLIEREK